MAYRIEIECKIADEGFMLYKVGQSYAGRPVDALKEYTSNSIDNFLGGGLENIDIKIRVDELNGTLYIFDNGTGMSRDKLVSLPENFSNSEKRNSLAPQIGENQLGLLAYQGFHPNNARMTIYSKNGASGLWYLTYPSGNEFRKKKKCVAGECKHDELPKEMRDFDHGTIIAIHNAPSSILNRLSPQMLQREMSAMYDPLMRHRAVRMTVGALGGGKIYVIEPVAYTGDKIMDTEKEIEVFDEITETTKKGKIEFLVFGSKNTVGQKVRSYTKGVRLKDSVTDLPRIDDEDHETWLSGHLSGYINETICRLNQERTSYIENDNFDELVREINAAQNSLAGRVRIYTESKEDAELKNLSKDFMKDADKFLRSIPNIYPELTLRVRKRNEESDGPEDEQEDDTPAPGPVTPKPPVHVTPRRSYRPIFDGSAFELEEERSKRSKIEGTTIYINTDHPDYKREVESSNSKRKAMYVWRQMSEQIAVAEVLRRSRINNLDTPKIADLINRVSDDMYYMKLKDLV